jgi:hypothetical protein
VVQHKVVNPWAELVMEMQADHLVRTELVVVEPVVVELLQDLTAVAQAVQVVKTV